MKSALITGASHGIGRALAVFLARRGYRSVCVARNQVELSETVDRIRTEGHFAEAIVADLREPSEVDALIGAVENRFGDLSLVAHLATPRPDPEVEASLTRTPSEQVSGYFDVGVKAAITVTTRLQPILARNAPSHLFFFGSDWALRGAHGPAVFAGAKAAVVHFARSIRREMARSGIRTTVLLPGDIASFDENWEQPIWDLDSPPEEVTARLGNGRILLSDITAVVGLALDMRTGRLEEAIVAPDNGDYDY